MHSLSFNLRDITIGGKVKELQLFNMYLPPFQGTIRNWTVDSKVISWTNVGYSFIISTSIKQVKGLELIQSVPFAFGICCYGHTSCEELSKDLSIQVKQTIVRLQKPNKSIREIAGTSGVAKSTVWYILRKKEHTSELSNIKRPGRPWRTTVVDDWRIFSMVKKNPSQYGISLSKSTIKRRLHQSKYRGSTTRCKKDQIRLLKKI